MQTHPITLLSERRDDPMRRAEARVFAEINASCLPRFAYYEWQRDHNSPQLDFALWLSGVGRFGLEVKGGQYVLKRGKWHLNTEDRPQKKCPLRKTWDATMSLHDELVGILEHEAFFIAVLVLPDMEPDQAITAKAERSNVNVLWVTDGLVDRLEQIATAREVYNPPDAEDIAREVAAVTDGEVLYEPPTSRPPRQDGDPLLPGIPPGAPMGIAAGHITIQHVDTLIVHAVPGETTGIDRLRDREDLAGG